MAAGQGGEGERGTGGFCYAIQIWSGVRRVVRVPEGSGEWEGDMSEIVGLVSVEERASLGKCGKEEESSQISEVGEVRREESQRKKGVFGIFPRGSRKIVEDDGGKVEKRWNWN